MSTQTKPLTRMQRYRAKMRAQGFRQIQLWVPDTRNPEVVARIQAECASLNGSPDEAEAMKFIEAAADWSAWEEPWPAYDEPRQTP